MPEKPPFSLEQLRQIAEAAERLKEVLKIPELQAQYESQIALLERHGLLETLSSGKTGFKDIGGREQILPTLQEFSKRLSPEQKALLEKKAQQGLTKVFLVPFGRELGTDQKGQDPQDPSNHEYHHYTGLLKTYAETLRFHHQQGTLLGTDGAKLNLDTNQPLWVWEKYANADKKGKLAYFPKAFDPTNHQGETKAQIIQEGRAWQLVITEDLADLPSEGKGQTIQGRKQMEANLTGHEYLNLLQTDPQYQGEQGLTPEAQIIRALTYLEEKNQVVDDCQGQGKINWLLGAYFPEDGFVPLGYWARGSSQARLGGGVPGDQGSDSAALPSVMI